MSHVQSDTSPTTLRHRHGIIRALSGFSKPVEKWGVSNVPVLSMSVTPRRGRNVATRLRQNSNSNSSTCTASSPRRRDSADVVISLSRVPLIRPLSIATVSSFGGWMSERVHEDGEANGTFWSQNSVAIGQRSSKTTSGHRAPPVTPVQHQHAIRKSHLVSLSKHFRHDLNSGMHPLRMNPPSLSLGLGERAAATRVRDIPLSQSPSEIPFPSTPSFDDAASQISQASFSIRCSRRTLPTLNIKAANDNASATSKNLESDDKQQFRSVPPEIVLVDKHSSFPRDVGCVEALRLWYEDKGRSAGNPHT